jgi:hypothetical protein
VAAPLEAGAENVDLLWGGEVFEAEDLSGEIKELMIDYLQNPGCRVESIGLRIEHLSLVISR